VLTSPQLADATMLLALTGWMDGGAVSTGTLRTLMEGRRLQEVARIRPDLFYIYNFPGTMEISALFRPEVTMRKGVIRKLDMPVNGFLCDPSTNLVFFVGKEPNLRWEEYADCVFEVTQRCSVKRIIFIGSFGGTVPHTREPRMFGAVSHSHLRSIMQAYGVRLSDYKGPASFSTYLLSQAPRRSVEMLSFVAEIPGYLQGINPLSIEAVSRRLAKILNVPVDFDAMRTASNAWEQQITEAVQQDQQLEATVQQLEEAYDNELLKEHGSGE